MEINLKISLAKEQYDELKEFIAKDFLDNYTFEPIAIDLEILSEILPYSRAFLEENILSHPKVKLYERRKGIRGKRIWLYEPTRKAILEVINEWEY